MYILPVSCYRINMIQAPVTCRCCTAQITYLQAFIHTSSFEYPLYLHGHFPFRIIRKTWQEKNRTIIHATTAKIGATTPLVCGSASVAVLGHSSMKLPHGFRFWHSKSLYTHRLFSHWYKVPFLSLESHGISVK